MYCVNVHAINVADTCMNPKNTELYTYIILSYGNKSLLMAVVFCQRCIGLSLVVSVIFMIHVPLSSMQ